jgi:hypothetical protein
MKKFVLLIAIALFILADAHAFNIELLQNNKESFSRELTTSEFSEAQVWEKNHDLGRDLPKMVIMTLSETMNEIERMDTHCELNLVARLQENALNNKIISTKGEVLNLIGWLRTNNLIDDIFYKVIKDATYLLLEFNNTDRQRPIRPLNLYTRQTDEVDLEKYFAPIKRWPDETKKCTVETYYKMIVSLTWKNERERDSLVTRLHFIGLNQGLIDLETYNRLETMRKRDVLSWPVYFKRYLDIINNTKDKLTKKPEKISSNTFAQEYVSRKESITQRTNLFKSYNSTQILILAQIIERTARRMDAKMATINWQYGENPTDQEIYVLSPMEQYRASIRFLRKDMADVMRSEAFQTKELKYEHLIAAAFEAGYIKSQELDIILKFEDFWNPKTPRWKTYANFAFSIAGSATFYLPTPFNIIGAIGLVLTQAKIVDGEKRPDPQENPNVII